MVFVMQHRKSLQVLCAKTKLISGVVLVDLLMKRTHVSRLMHSCHSRLWLFCSHTHYVMAGDMGCLFNWLTNRCYFCDGCSLASTWDTEVFTLYYQKLPEFHWAQTSFFPGPIFKPFTTVFEPIFILKWGSFVSTQSEGPAQLIH